MKLVLTKIFVHRKILKISPAAQTIATENNFIIKLNKFEDEELERRILRVGAIQTSIVASTSDQIELQRDKMFQKVGKLFEAAAIEGVNIMCLPELWCKLLTVETQIDFCKTFSQICHIHFTRLMTLSGKNLQKLNPTWDHQ